MLRLKKSSYSPKHGKYIGPVLNNWKKNDVVKGIKATFANYIII